MCWMKNNPLNEAKAKAIEIYLLGYNDGIKDSNTKSNKILIEKYKEKVLGNLIGFSHIPYFKETQKKRKG